MKKSLFPILVMLGVSFLFTSCKNFLNADKVSDQIKDIIAYNNAKVVTVNIYSSEDIGSIYPQTKYEARIGYPFELEFIPNKQNYVIKNPDEVFKAVSFKDNSQSRSDYVEIIPVKQSTKDKQENVYKAQIKILQAADDILIKPNVQLVPQVIQSFPNYDNAGYPQDTSIKIYFNKAMDINSFADENGFLKNITITSGEKDLLERLNGKEPHYKAPYLEDENQTLVIPVLKGNYIIKDDSKADINVSLRLKGLYDGVEGENIEFAQEEYNFTFRINSSKDDKGPVFDKLYIAKTQEDALNGTNLIPMQEFSYYAKKSNFENSQTKVKKNIQDHHVNKVWIYFEAQDASSGVDFFEIKEQLIRTTTGYNTTGTLYNKTNRPVTNKFANDTDTNSLAKLIEYDFNEIEDGVVKLELIAEDHAGNKTSCLVDLVKDTECPISPYVSDKSLKFQTMDQKETEYTFRIEVDSVNYQKYPFVTDMDNEIYYDSFLSNDRNDFLLQTEIIGIEYGTDIASMNYIDLQNSSYNIEEVINPYPLMNDSFGFAKFKNAKIKVKADSDIYINIYSKDSAGNTQKTSQVIYTCNIFGCAYAIKDAGSFIVVTFSDDPGTGGLYCKHEDEDTPQFLSEIKSAYSQIAVTQAIKDKLEDEGKYSFYYVKNATTFEEVYPWSSKPYILEKNSTGWINPAFQGNNALPALTTADVPKITAIKDTYNDRLVHVTFENGFVFNKEYLYIISYYYSSQEFSYDTSFIVPDQLGPAVYVLCYVMNKNGNAVITPEEERPLVYLIDTNPDDIKPPSFNFGNANTGQFNLGNIYRIEPGKIIYKKALLSDNREEIKSFKYFLSNDSNLSGQIDWDNDTEVQTSQLEGDYFTINTRGENFTYIYFYAKDSSGNYKEDKKRSEYIYIDSEFDIEYNDYFTYKINDKYGYFVNQYLSGNEWQFTNSSANGYLNIHSAISVNATLNSFESNSYIKLQMWDALDSFETRKYMYSDIIYFYPPKYSGNIICDLKDYTQKNDRISVWADKPCLVHTMYSERNLGDDAQRWVNLGQETGIVMKQQSFTYTFEDNLSQVPENYYYTIVIHFADGDMMMTDVKQMQ